LVGKAKQTPPPGAPISGLPEIGIMERKSSKLDLRGATLPHTKSGLSDFAIQSDRSRIKSDFDWGRDSAPACQQQNSNAIALPARAGRHSGWKFIATPLMQ
jgi:hypothetical protein